MSHIAFTKTNEEQGTRVEVIADYAGAYRVVLVDTDAEAVVGVLYFRDEHRAIIAAEQIAEGAVLPGDFVTI